MMWLILIRLKKEKLNYSLSASPIHYQHDPIQTAKTSVMGAINMLGLAMRLDAKILQASTSRRYMEIQSFIRNRKAIGEM